MEGIVFKEVLESGLHVTEMLSSVWDLVMSFKWNNEAQEGRLCLPSAGLELMTQWLV